jgi:hypothetical protein
MDIDVVDSLDDVDADAFDRLDSSAGAAGCYERTRQRGSDGRWRARYLRAVDGDRLVGMVPLYTATGGTWPDPAYDPGTWGLPDGTAAGCTADRSLLVGGYADLRSGLPVDDDLLAGSGPRTLLARIARLAAEEGRCLVLPYAYTRAKQALDRACEGAIGWTVLGREAHLRGVSEPGWEAAQRKPVRYNLRHDRALIAEAGLRVGILSWPQAEKAASLLIAEHNVRKGQPDHPEFVTMRNQQWDACPSVEFTVFAGRAGTAAGFVTGWVWRDELEIYEIGLRGEESPQRFALYLDLVFHQPIRFAQERGLRCIRLGPAAERAKAGRGAQFEDLYGGVLNMDETRRLAAG